MARILYGIQSVGKGHVTRALTVARSLPEHEFLFVCNGNVADRVRKEYPVEEFPGLSAVVEANRTRYWASIVQNVRMFAGLQSLKRRMIRIIERFQPDAAGSDLEFFVPWAARAVGLPCFSLDHQHVLTTCEFSVPIREMPNFLIDSSLVRLFFDRASLRLVTSFFHPKLRKGVTAQLVGPILRQLVLEREASDGDHILAFNGFARFERLLPTLRNQSRPVIVYGFDVDRREGNLTFRKTSQKGFLDDLASCAYAICGGGHTLVAEALLYGKPVLCFPGVYFEQRLSSSQVELLGYGRYVRRLPIDHADLQNFESRLEKYKSTILPGHFYGNPEAISRIRRFVADAST